MPCWALVFGLSCYCGLGFYLSRFSFAFVCHVGHWLFLCLACSSSLGFCLSRFFFNLYLSYWALAFSLCLGMLFLSTFVCIDSFLTFVCLTGRWSFLDLVCFCSLSFCLPRFFFNLHLSYYVLAFSWLGLLLWPYLLFALVFP